MVSEEPSETLCGLGEIFETFEQSWDNAGKTIIISHPPIITINDHQCKYVVGRWFVWWLKQCSKKP